MGNKITINNFGPIRNAEIDLDKSFQILIGAQASGKSTICKVVYFCQKIRDYTLDFMMDADQFTQNHKNEYFNNYLKYLTKKFMGCFGTTKHMPDFQIGYCFEENRIQICLNKDGYVRFRFDEKLKNSICALMMDAAGIHLEELSVEESRSILDHITTFGIMKRHLRDVLFSTFKSETDILYIPAGRSLLATMSEQLHEVSVSEMDLIMQEFIHLIRTTKSRFGNKIPEMVKSYTKTEKGQINNSAVEQAYVLIRKILKADYTSEDDGEKIYFDEDHWVKLMYGSSGQQEALWILMLVFVTILENKKTYFVIEEPEAHLFPIAQKEIISLISLMVHTTGSQVILTTHSPYVLTSANILLYSEKVEGMQKRTGDVIVPKNLRLSYDDCAAYKVSHLEQSMESLMDEESHMISTEYIDEVSAITNKELDALIDMEINE